MYWEIQSLTSRKKTGSQIKKAPKIRGDFSAERAGLEPATLRLTAECSTIELPFSIFGF